MVSPFSSCVIPQRYGKTASGVSGHDDDDFLHLPGVEDS